MQKKDNRNNKKVVLNYALNTIIVILVFLIVYFVYSIVASKDKKDDGKITIKTSRDSVPLSSKDTLPGAIITVEVLNGSGESKLAYKVSDFLKRQSGVDVQKYDNFRTNDIQETIVQSRDGNIQKAKKIAAIIGVDESRVNIVRGDEFDTEVRIIIGKDFRKLKIDL
jgi:hypothetical protein